MKNPEALGRRMSRQGMLKVRSGGRARLALGQVPGASLAPKTITAVELGAELVRSRACYLA